MMGAYLDGMTYQTKPGSLDRLFIDMTELMEDHVPSGQATHPPIAPCIR
jgi:hypothetical protein